MIEGINFQNPVFVNTLGHISGVAAFGLLIILLLKSGEAPSTRRKTASLVAACLAFLWNLGSLFGLAFFEGHGQMPDWLVAVNFSILSLLPAVLFSVLLKRARPLLARLGYAIGFCSVLLHFAEARVHSAHLHEAGLLVVTIGFAVLGVIVLATAFPQSKSRIIITDVVCLILFTASFLHFGYDHSRTAWTSEITWHHAGIPLALIVLLRDYRQLVAETFIRFIANVGLAGVFAAAIYAVAESGSLLTRARANGFTAALLAVVFCGCFILFAYVRSILQKRLTRYVFGRGDLTACSKQILQASSESATEQEFLEHASTRIARFVESDRFELVDTAIDRAKRWAEVELPLHFSRGDTLTLLLGRRHGSRRYLAEDLNALRSLAGLVVEQVERIRANQLLQLAHDAELRALQAQVNPHFLFNALNTLYGVINRESLEARRLVLNLADLFRHCLQRDRTLIPLGEELEIVRSYLEIESLRLGDRLKFEITASEAARHAKIPILCVQPLVENAIKHGISKLSANGLVQVIAAARDGRLEITVRDNGPGFLTVTTETGPNSMRPGLGLGLENVRQRLRLTYGDDSGLKISSNEKGSVVTLSINLSTAVTSNMTSNRRSIVAADTLTEPARRL